MRFRFRRRQPLPPLEIDKSASSTPLDSSDAVPTPPAEFHLGDTQAADARLIVEGQAYRHE